jgi:DNA-binding MarR family transcriptional regulator
MAKKIDKKYLVDFHQDGVTMTEAQIFSRVTKRHFGKGEFCMIHLSLPDLKKKKNYCGTTYRVMMLLICNIDYNNRIKTFRQVDLAAELGTKQANISRALHQLQGDGIIYKHDNDYYFNDKYVKGAGDDKIRKRRAE